MLNQQSAFNSSFNVNRNHQLVNSRNYPRLILVPAFSQTPIISGPSVGLAEAKPESIFQAFETLKEDLTGKKGREKKSKGK
jgi:hypothetical protein